MKKKNKEIIEKIRKRAEEIRVNSMDEENMEYFNSVSNIVYGDNLFGSIFDKLSELDEDE